MARVLSTAFSRFPPVTVLSNTLRRTPTDTEVLWPIFLVASKLIAVWVDSAVDPAKLWVFRRELLRVMEEIGDSRCIQVALTVR